MKKRILIILLFSELVLLICLCSCSQYAENEFVSHSDNTQNDFQSSFQKLNASYIRLHPTQSKANDGNGNGNDGGTDKKEDDPGVVIVTCVDYLGATGGQWLGGEILVWAGTAIGSVPGGIFGGIIGFLYRAAIGGLCAEFVSDVASSAVQDCNGYAVPFLSPHKPTGLYDTNIIISDIYGSSSWLDSVGYYHNQYMQMVENEPFKMAKKKGLVYSDVEQRLQRCFDHIEDVYSEGLDMKVMKNLMDQDVIKSYMLDILNEFLKYCNQELTYSQFLVNIQILLADKYKMPENVQIQIKNGLEIINVCNQLSVEQIYSYSSELNTLINSSNLTIDDKIMFAVNAQIAINSSLCWKNGEFIKPL